MVCGRGKISTRDAMMQEVCDARAWSLIRKSLRSGHDLMGGNRFSEKMI